MVDCCQINNYCFQLPVYSWKQTVVGRAWMCFLFCMHSLYGSDSNEYAMNNYAA